MSILPDDAHIKTLARLLVDRMANPDNYADMNDGTVDWSRVYGLMREAQADEDHMGSVLAHGLIALSGYNPWGGSIITLKDTETS